MDQNPEWIRPRKRRRPAVSCIACRRRKIKCDRNTPCSQCSNLKGQDCAYAPEDGPTSRKKQSIPANASLTAISSHSPAETGESRNPLTSSVAARFVQSDPASDFVLVDSDQRKSSQPPAVDGADVTPDNSTAPAARVNNGQGDPAANTEQNKRGYFAEKYEDKPSFVRGSISKGRLFGQSHWSNTYEQYDKLVNMRHLIIYSEEIETALKECKALARMAKSARSLPVDTSLLPSLVPIRETADELIQLYFRTYESTYRILHVQSFLGEYAKYWENPLAASPLFVAKLLLVMTIGTCFHKDESIRALISHWLQAVQSFMSGPNEKGRLNTSGIQINCLLLLAKQSSFSGDDLNWISAGSLLRMAMNLGFHRDPKYFPKMTFFQAELRRRLWWSILELCVQYALDSGMPPLISFDDFDTNIPLNINDNEYDENTKEIPAVAPEGVSTHMSIQLVLIRSLKTRLSITSLLNGFKNFLTYEQCLELGSTLTAELRSQNLVLNGFRASASSICVPTNFHKSLVDVITRRFLLALHLPWTMLATPDPRYYFSRKVSLDTVLTLCSYTKNSVQPALAIEDEDEYYTLLKSRGGGVFRMVMVLGAMTICLECYKQIQEESPLSRDLLHTTLGELVDLAKQRVEYGETNVQGYLWLSVAKAHIDALETGQPIKEVAQATASKTMEYAQEMLKRQTSRVSGAATPMEDTASGDDFSWEFLIQSQNYTESIFDTPKSWWFSEWGNADIGTI